MKVREEGRSKALFGNARRKGGALAKIIPAEITHKNVKGPPTFQELVADRRCAHSDYVASWS